MSASHSFWLRLILLCAFFFGLASFLPIANTSGQVQTALSMASFVFGIFLAFFTVNAQTRLSTIANGLQVENAALLLLAQASQVFPASVRKALQGNIDQYLTSQVDYKLKDFHLSKPGFNKLFLQVVALEPKTEKQTFMQGKMLDELSNMTKNRQMIESNVQAFIEKFEWTNLILLLVVTLACLISLNDGTLFIKVVTSLLATTSVIMLWTLYDLDKLHWQEETRIWIPLQRTFKELGLVPYYTEQALLRHRVGLPAGRVRIAYCPRPYPDMTGKVVKQKTMGLIYKVTLK